MAGTDALPDGENLPLNLLRHFADATPDAPCLTFRADTLSFHELLAASVRLANALEGEGIGPGDRVAIIAPSAPIFYELLFACSMIGAVMMPLNARLAPREIAGIVEDGAPRLIFLDRELTGLVTGINPLPRIIRTNGTYTRWRDAASDDEQSRSPQPDEPILLLYTSGTTGQPKGVTISQRNMLAVSRTASQAWGFTADSVNLVAMPLFHIGGIGYGLMALSQGGHTVLLDTLDPAEVIGAMIDHRVTHAFFVPAVIQRLVEEVERNGRTVESLQRLIYGASPISENLLGRAMSVFGCGFNHAYGMTETAGTVITLAPEDHGGAAAETGRLRSCGRAFPWAEVALVDPATEQPVADGEVGEIRVRGDMITPEYWNKPGETARAITDDGWLCTGDAAYRDADGYFFIHDRYKDMIISGGENVYPAEVENVLAGHDAVSEVAVVGIAHEKWGETPRAYIVAASGAPGDPDAIIAYARDNLAHYKCPTSVVFVDELPRNASGKILKHELRAMAQAEQAR